MKVRRTALAVLLIAALLHAGPMNATEAGSATTAQAAPAVDVTGDGRADMVIREAGRLYVYPHNGSTTANPWTTRYDTGTTGWDTARVLLLADATGDGRPDIITIRTDQTLWVYPHNGSSGTAANWGTPYATGLTGWDIADWIGVGDLTGDGRPDLVARHRADGSLWVYPHNGSGGTSASWAGLYSVGVNWNGATALLLGDVTGDGRTDLVARDAAGNLVIHATGSGAQISGGSGWNLAGVLLLQDVTGDGRPEITIRDSAGAAWVYRHNGSATSNPWTQTRYAGGTGWNIASAMLL